MPSVKQRPCIQSLIFPPSTLVFLSQRPFTLNNQMTQMSSLERRSPFPMPLWSWRLKENQGMRKPVKLQTPWPLMQKKKFLFVTLFCTSILRTIMFYPSCFRLCFTRHVLGYVLPVIYVDIFIFCLFALTLINPAPLFCWYFAWDVSVYFI